MVRASGTDGVPRQPLRPALDDPAIPPLQSYRTRQDELEVHRTQEAWDS